MTELLEPSPMLLVAAIAVIAGAILLAVEIRYARALTAQTLHGGALSEHAARLGGKALLHRARTHRVRFVARWLSWAPTANVEMTVRRLFRAAPELEERDRWRRWHRVHLPPFIVRAAKKNPARQERILQSVFAGLRESIATVREAAQSGALTLDSLWPFVETVEELGVHCRRNLHDLFAVEMRRTAAAIDDEAVHTVCAWVVNELLERGDNERALGGAIATELADNGPPACVEALRVLHDLYKRVAEHRGHQKPQEEAFFDAVEGTSVVLRVGDESNRNHLLRKAPAAALESFKTEIAKHNGSEGDERATALARHLMTECEDLFKTADSSSSLAEVRALAGLRWTFRIVSDTGARDSLWNDQTVAMFPVFVDHLCTQIMERVISNPRASAFITIESMEPIRAKAPAEVAKAMARFVGRLPRLDPGIAVCICEGVEEGRQAIGGRERENRYYFVRRHGKWVPGVDAPEDATIAIFWRQFAEPKDRRRIDDLAQWMNLRLELRGI